MIPPNPPAPLDSPLTVVSPKLEPEPEEPPPPSAPETAPRANAFTPPTANFDPIPERITRLVPESILHACGNVDGRLETSRGSSLSQIVSIMAFLVGSWMAASCPA